MRVYVIGFVCLLSGVASAQAPALTPPVLVSSVEAKYPPQALQQRVSGRVVLRLDIDASGAVTYADVTEPAGYGFDENAIAAAYEFRFQPATRDGTAIASRILYTYVYELKPEAPEPEPVVALPPEAVSEPDPADAPLNDDEVQEVSVRGERAEREVTVRNVTREELRTSAGTNGDALRAIQNLPGVARAPGLTGQLVVRGSSPDDTEAYIDGTFVPFVYHFGGLASVLPTEMLESIDFYPGNFGARFGRVAGGIVDVHTRSADADKFHGMAQLDLIDARALARGPIAYGWQFVAGARRSHVDAWIGSFLAEGSSSPYYSDAQLFLENKLTSHSKLRFGFFGAYDELRIVNESGGGEGGTFSAKQSFYRFTANYDDQITERLALKLSTGWGIDSPNYTLGSRRIETSLSTFTARGEIAYKLANWLSVSAGYDILAIRWTADLRFPAFAEAGESDPGPDTTARQRVYRGDGWFTRPAVYVQSRLTPIPHLELVPSLRIDDDRENGNLDFGPRLNVRYDISNTFPRTTVKAASGLFFKDPTYRESLPVVGSPGVQSSRVHASSLSLEQDLTRSLTLSLEGFYKNIDRIISRTPAANGNYDYANDGTGRSFGGELLVRYNDGTRSSAVLAYTLSRSTRVDLPGEKRRLFEYDQTHVLTVLGTYRLSESWLFSTRYRVVSGNPYTPCVGGRLDSSAGTYACVEGAEYSKRMPLFHQLDVRIEKTWAFTSWKLSAYLDLINAYNRKNAESATYNFDKSRSGYSYGLPLIPSIGIRGEL